MCYIPDPIERLEMWENKMAYELCNEDGSLNCVRCGEQIESGQEEMTSGSPYGLPICKKCVDKIVDEIK